MRERKGGGVGGRWIWKGKGEIKGANEEGVVGEVGGERLEGGGCKGVGLGRRRSRQERRKDQRANIFGWTNGKRRKLWFCENYGVWKMLVRRANGKRRMVWELRGKGV